MSTFNKTTSTTTINTEQSIEEGVYTEELGTIVFQSALLQYLSEKESDEAEAFENFIDVNVASDSFLEDLCDEYPEFEKLLWQEMSLLSKELKEVAPAK